MSGRKGWILTLAVPVLIAGAVLLYLNRGAIRQSMLRFLHSFDDQEEADVEEDHAVPPGKWGLARDSVQDRDSTAADENMQQIQSLGYLSGYEEAPVQRGVTRYVDTLACNGYSIVMSGHESSISMIDMEGNEVHVWRVDDDTLRALWESGPGSDGTMFILRRMCLDQDGYMYVVVEDFGVLKISPGSDIIWASDFNGAHHDIDLDPSGKVYVVGREIHINPDYNQDEQIAEEYIYVLDSLGRTERRIPILETLRNSPFAPVISKMKPSGDIMHCNTVEYIGEADLPGGGSGPFRPGSVLISLREVNLVCAIDLSSDTVYWAESDLWMMQHEPTLLDNGNVMVFDNRGLGERSTVLEFDPLTREVLWSYSGTESDPFYSEIAGSCQPLPNGNVLITESVYGRVFEVTPDKRIVWEYYNPYRAGENMELIAILFDVVRVSPEMGDLLLQN